MPTLTFLFVDQVGSTDQLETLGDERASPVRDALFRVLRAALTSHDGTEIDHTGDGLMATFTSAVDGTACAVAMQQGVGTHNLRSPGEHGLQIRVGVHTGEPVLNEEGRAFGLPIVIASRMCATAAPGQILVSDVTRVLAAGRAELQFRAVAALVLKGVSEPVTAAEVVWELPDPAAPRWRVPPRLAAIDDLPFVGRKPESELLRAAWGRAVAGDRSTVLISGEPGIGKTRLVSELATEVCANDGRVLFGWCDDEFGVPYQPFVEALQYFVDHVPPSALPARLGRYGGELTRLVPEVAGMHDFAPPLQSEPEIERYRLFDAVASWLAATSEDQPLLLVLDDLHWGATPTLLLLQHLVRATEPAHLLIVGTYRDTDLGRTHPLAAVLADLRRTGGCDRLGVTGLDETEVTEFVEVASGQALDAAGYALARVIHAETEGNAFFMTEVVRHLAESGAVARSEGRWAPAADIVDLGVPEGVREVVGRRLSRLSDPANEVLALAAVIGRDYEFALLEAAGDQDETTLLGALDEAVTARLADETGPGRYRFTHSLVQSTLYGELRPTRRARLHRRVAEALEHTDDERVAELAYHYAQATAGGDTTKAVEYATRAGDQARAQLAHDEAVVFYTRALEMLDSDDPSERSRRCDLLIALGTAQREAGHADHRSTLLAAGELAGSLGSGVRMARAALANSRQWGWSTTGQIDAERVAALERAAEKLGRDDPAMQARLLAHLACELVFDVDGERRADLSAQAVEIARNLDDPETLARVLHLRFVAVQWAITRAERYELISEALALGAELSDPLLTGMPTVDRAGLAVEDGDLALAAALLDAGTRIADDLRQPGIQWLVVNWRAVLAATRGEFADAERLTGESFELGQLAGQPDALMLFGSQMFNLRYLQGRVPELGDLLIDSVMDQLGPGGPAVDALLAVLYTELDEHDEASAAFERIATDDFAGIPEGYLWRALVALSAVTCTRLGDAPRAELLEELLLPHAESLVVAGPTCFGSTWRYIGLAAATCGHFDAADAAFSAAADVHQRIGARPWLALTEVDWARMLLVRNGPSDRTRARELLDRALTTARELGMIGTETAAMSLLENS